MTLSVDHKHRLKLARVNGRAHGGTLVFRCSICQVEMAFKRHKIQKLISGVKYKVYGSHMRCS